MNYFEPILSQINDKPVVNIRAAAIVYAIIQVILSMVHDANIAVGSSDDEPYPFLIKSSTAGIVTAGPVADRIVLKPVSKFVQHKKEEFHNVSTETNMK